MYCSRSPRHPAAQQVTALAEGPSLAERSAAIALLTMLVVSYVLVGRPCILTDQFGWRLNIFVAILFMGFSLVAECGISPR